MSQDAVVSPANMYEVRRAFGTFVTGVAVVTFRSDDGMPHGGTGQLRHSRLTRSALGPGDADPELGAARYLKGAPFALNVLSSEQMGVALQFAGSAVGKKPVWALDGNVPALLNNAATLACRPWNIYDGGDHLIVVGEVISQKITERAIPLLFFGGKFRQIGNLVDGAPLDQSCDSSDSGWFAGAVSFKPLGDA